MSDASSCRACVRNAPQHENRRRNARRHIALLAYHVFVHTSPKTRRKKSQKKFVVVIYHAHQISTTATTPSALALPRCRLRRLSIMEQAVGLFKKTRKDVATEGTGECVAVAGHLPRQGHWAGRASLGPAAAAVVWCPLVRRTFCGGSLMCDKTVHAVYAAGIGEVGDPNVDHMHEKRLELHLQKKLVRQLHDLCIALAGALRARRGSGRV